MPGIGVINNPYSRRNLKDPSWMQSLGYIVGTKGTATATESVEDIHQVARFFAEREIDVLAINGGDGSNSMVLTALIHEYGRRPLPKIALLRGGTMNNVANSCRIKGTSAGLMMNLVRKYREGVPFETSWRDTLKIEERYGFIFGNGFTQRFLEVLYESGNKNPWSITKLLARSAVSTITGGRLARRLFERVRARVLVDGRELPNDSFAALAAATVEQLGFGFKPFHRCQQEAHTFHLLGIISSPAALTASLPKIYLGRRVSEKKMIEVVGHEAQIETETPLGYTLDGETYTGGPCLRIETGPRLEIIVS